MTASIKARATRFDLSRTPAHWVPGHPYGTHTLNTLHVVLPPGERWFCDVYRDALDQIEDPALLDDVQGFIAQEATHAKAHDRGLAFLAEHGVDVRREVAWVDRRRLALRRRVRGLPRPLRRRVLKVELAIIAAIEHYTAFLGDWVLTARGLDAVGTDGPMLDLIRWHAAEEVEHRDVAFDLYQHVDGSYLRRAVHGTLLSVGLMVGLFLIAGRLAQLDPELRRGYRYRDYRAAVDAGVLPRVSEVVASLRHYLRRDHHPSQFGDLDVALAYLATSPGVVRRPAS